MKDRVMLSFSCVFSDFELERIYIFYSAESTEIQVDLHGLSCREAERLVRTIIALIPNDHFSITLIHGFHRGQALKDLFTNTFSNNRVRQTISHSDNPGRTTLII